ncbi:MULTISPECIES: dUTP diphosphatase [Carboxydothermus]|uniref:dUTP diphosphatase n=2 Tax=Carboxydothermus TaxID=129957 RepID=Q3AFB3_CARHZ|nr:MULTISPECIES: dUTP diphosphatase [Carboxydothermus]ABB14538.1 deoxyuridine 5`-triphosphate nucleotidohydrolase [Carboxydothermus hydrogenoformans Z-2901]NYE57299.1 dUTP pyrophosphatase [Carboxydothermus ferrireducens DSM 11255]
MRGFKVVSFFEDKGINIPQRKTKASAGYDLEAAIDVVLNPGEVKLVPTGVKAYMPEDEVLLIYIRSSLAVKKGLLLANGVGVVDADYYDNPENEGHIMIPLFNPGKEPVTIRKGERIAQGIFTRYLKADDDEALGQRTGGFGSTGQ